jgi:hypothetical protein
VDGAAAAWAGGAGVGDVVIGCGKVNKVILPVIEVIGVEARTVPARDVKSHERNVSLLWWTNSSPSLVKSIMLTCQRRLG